MDLQKLYAENRERYLRMVRLKKQETPETSVICPKCYKELNSEKMRKNFCMCQYCGHHFPMKPYERISMIGDIRTYREFQKDVKTKDPLEFPGYKEKLEKSRNMTGGSDAVSTGVMNIRNIRTAVAVMDGRFMMGSMGTAVGEKITGLVEYAGRKEYPLIIFSASGGARMQEGLFSLMQMAKTSAAVEKYKENGGLFISVLTDPTTGGVSASFASLGDIIIAEPEALICFAGPRVIEQTIGHTLPEGFQRAEFLEEHGMVDMVLGRRDMEEMLYRILKLHSRPKDSIAIEA